MQNLDRYCFMLLLTGYVGKLLILGANLPDALVVAILAGANFLYHSQIQNKKIVQLDQQVAQQAADAAEQKKELENLRNAIASVKISQGLQKVR